MQALASDQGPPEVRWHFGSFSLLETQRRLERSGQAVKLGPRSFDLLLMLVQRSGEFLSNENLLSMVWAGLVVEEGSVRAHVVTLRKALGEPGEGDGCREWITNVPLRGYRFNGRVQCEVIAPASVGPTSTARPPLPKHNLPHQLTSFIGREKDIEQLKKLLTSKRLLTLTGAGGCGKTRLGLQLAGEMLSEFADGCSLVELAPLGEPTLLVPSVASALCVKAQVGQDLADTTAQWLEPKRLLLVLDNAEHLLEGCAELADKLLRRCAHLVILVTSRERLGITGEFTWRVPSLSVPDPRQEATTERVLACEAARLFVERAQLQARLSLTAENAPALASICHRLDGIPLALELAAARLRSMSLEDVSRRLDERFGLLTGGSRTAPPRHRTLRSLIDWSYDHLSEAEQQLLRRVSVFSGGWTLDAAEKVCVDEGMDTASVLDVLTALVDKSLARAEDAQGIMRYRLLETVRHYARDRMREGGEEAQLRPRHLAWLLEFSREAQLHMDGPEQPAWFARLEAEHDNVRSALEWASTDEGAAVEGLRLANTLIGFWTFHAHYGEARAWFARLLAASPGVPETLERAWSLYGMGLMASFQADYAAAQSALQSSLAIHRTFDNRLGILHATHGLGHVAGLRVDLPNARAHYEEGRALAEELGNEEMVVNSLFNLGEIALRLQEFQTARPLLEKSLAIGRETGNARYVSHSLTCLGRLAHCEGDHSSAKSLLEASLPIHRKLGFPQGIAEALTALALLQLDLNDYPAAQDLLEEALAISHDNESPRDTCKALEGYAALASCLNDAGSAARLWGCTERLREQFGSEMEPWERGRHDRWLAIVHAALGDDETFELAWREGRSMTLVQGMNHALGIGAGRNRVHGAMRWSTPHPEGSAPAL